MGGEEARDRAEVRYLDPAWIRKSGEQARARCCEAMKEKARLKHEAEKRQKKAKRQYDLKRYANPAVREKARARYREGAKAKARLKGNEERDHDDPSCRLGGPMGAERQYSAKRHRDPAARERREERKRLHHEAIESKVGNHQYDEAKYDDDDDDNENCDSESVKTPIPKRESRARLGDELDRLKGTDLGLVEAIIGFHRGLTKFLETSHGRDQLQDFCESRTLAF